MPSCLRMSRGMITWPCSEAVTVLMVAPQKLQIKCNCVTNVYPVVILKSATRIQIMEYF